MPITPYGASPHSALISVRGWCPTPTLLVAVLQLHYAQFIQGYDAMRVTSALLQLLPVICRTTPAQIRVLETQLAQLRSQAAEVEDKRTKLQQRQSAALDALSASTGRKLPVGPHALIAVQWWCISVMHVWVVWSG